MSRRPPPPPPAPGLRPCQRVPQPSRSTRVHRGDKAEGGARETACNLRRRNHQTRPPPLAEVASSGEACLDRGTDDGRGIPSNVPGYLPPSIPSPARRPPAGHLSALCKRRKGGRTVGGEGGWRCLIGLLHCFYLLFIFASLTLSGSIYLLLCLLFRPVVFRSRRDSGFGFFPVRAGLRNGIFPTNYTVLHYTTGSFPHHVHLEVTLK